MVYSQMNRPFQQWNTTLGTSASNYAAKCIFLTHSGTPGVGENLYVTSSSVVTGLGAAASKAWADEFYNYGPQGYTFSSKTGHATQMAWATTKTVGCGYALCKNGPSGFTSYTNVVCQYYRQ
ncbi:unnamed protein product, partial [Mesorhabditis belari]|uniref:SCP domain-containing protein n=1 Tax=Mesorhabditis belari TaxID=2138241 RepID=A0AAF3FNK4_9BILA